MYLPAEVSKWTLEAAGVQRSGRGHRPPGGEGASVSSPPPVQVVDQALAVAAGQLAQQLLVFPEQTKVIGEGEGLQGQAGELVHHVVAVQAQGEVVPRLRSSRHDAPVLQLERGRQLERAGAALTRRCRCCGNKQQLCVDVLAASHVSQEDSWRR